LKCGAAVAVVPALVVVFKDGQADQDRTQEKLFNTLHQEHH
jgi:hypothetical protein